MTTTPTPATDTAAEATDGRTPSAEAISDGREPFKVSFDWETNHCSPGVSEACAALPDDIKALYTQGPFDQDDDMVAYLLREHLDTHPDLPDDVRELVEDAIATIGPHDGCGCASDNHEWFISFVDELLGGLGTSWAVLSTDKEPEQLCDIDHNLSYEHLAEAAGADRMRNGPTEITFTWDGRKLEAKFDWNVVDAFELTDAEVLVAKELEEIGTEMPNCVAVVYGVAPSSITVDLWTELEPSGFTEQFYFDSFIEAVAPRHEAFAQSSVCDAFVALAPTWRQPLPELIDTCVLAAAPVAA